MLNLNYLSLVFCLFVLHSSLAGRSDPSCFSEIWALCVSCITYEHYVSWAWLSPLQGWDSLMSDSVTMALFLGVCMCVCVYIYANLLFSNIEHFYLRSSCFKDSTLNIGRSFSFKIIVDHSSCVWKDNYFKENILIPSEKLCKATLVDKMEFLMKR